MLRRAILVVFLAVLCGCVSDPAPNPRAGQRYAILQTDVPRTAHSIFPVTIYQIDGREINSPRGVHRVPVGTHSIKARAVVDRRFVRGVSRDLSRDPDLPLVHHFVSGTRYFIGLKADSPRRADWRLVVWKTEEVDEGTVQFDQ